MNKLLPFFMLIILSVVLSGCAIVEEVFTSESSQFQEALIKSRDHLIQTNVGLYVTDEQQGLLPGRSESRLGSGVVFYEDDEYYYVLSSFHVIEPTFRAETTYEVKPQGFDEDETLNASLIDYEEDYDLALLRFDKTLADMEIINVTERINRPLRQTEFVLAAGNPSGIDSVITFGRYERMAQIDKVSFNVIAHSAQIYPGNSGGLLADYEGNLIGINNWSSDNNEYNYAVGLEEIYTFLEDSDYDFSFLREDS